MNQLHESIRRFKNLSTSLMEASVSKAMKVADKIAASHRLDPAPIWLNGIGVRVDMMRNGYVEVGVLPSYPLPNFPSHVDGVPVVVIHRSMARARVQ